MFGTELEDDLTGFFHTNVVREHDGEVVEAVDGLLSRALIIFGGEGLFVPGHGFAEHPFGGVEFVVGVFFDEFFVGVGGEHVVFLFFAGDADAELGKGSDGTLGSIGDDLDVHFGGFVHGSVERE